MAAIVLGSGLGRLGDRLAERRELPYREIPGFPEPEVEGHAGRLVAGSLNGRALLCQSGRFHAYEGHPAELLALPIRLFAALGIRTLLLTNAAGGIRRGLRPGSLLLLADQVNLTFRLRSRLRGDPAIRALFCIAPLQFAIQSAEPFFAPYVLRHLDAGYGTYLALVAAAFLGHILILPTAGSFARRFGARRILWAGSLGLVPIAALWSVSASPVWLVVVQLLAGMAWGTFELGTFLLLFDAAPYRERTAVATVYYFVMAAAAAGGSLAGGWLLEACGSTRDSYLALFAASTLARIVAFRLVAKGTKPDGPGLITCV